MRILCPLCGLRDRREFYVSGAAVRIGRPAPGEGPEAMDDYLHLRTNPEGPLDEFWQHEQGCRAWLIVTRDTGTHEVLGVRLAQDMAGGNDAA